MSRHISAAQRFKLPARIRPRSGDKACPERPTPLRGAEPGRVVPFDVQPSLPRVPAAAASPAACGDCAEMQVRVDVPLYYPSMELRYRLVLAALFVALVGVMVFLFTYAPPGPGVTD